MFIPISQSKSFKHALLAGALLLTSAGMSFADYNAGSSAFNGGNYVRAYQEFKQSADAGNSLAQFMMGRLYAEGRGVVADIPLYWRGRAASRGECYEVSGSRRVFDRFMLDGLTRLGDVLAGSRRGMTGTQERSGAQECDQGEG